MQFFQFLVVFGVRSLLVCAAYWCDTLSPPYALDSYDQLRNVLILLYSLYIYSCHGPARDTRYAVRVASFLSVMGRGQWL